jgi:hypothetical protein
MQLYRCFVSQSSDFYYYNHLCCFSTNVYFCCLFSYRLSPEPFDCTLVLIKADNVKNVIHTIIVIIPI